MPNPKVGAIKFGSFGTESQREFLTNEVFRLEGELFNIQSNLERQTAQLALFTNPTTAMKKQEAGVLTALEKRITTERNGNQVTRDLCAASLEATKLMLAKLPNPPAEPVEVE